MIRPLLCWLLAAAFARAAAAGYTPSNLSTPPVAREFRGTWVATVNNIDWPSKPGLPVPQQQAELLAILNRADQLRLNVVILQMRPACDAFYASKLEPWSEYLTGAQGRAPSPAWDPLEFALTEAHRRGIELHAWLNPFRARFGSASPVMAKTHISQRQPALAKNYGKSLWLDPGLVEVHDHSMRVVLDLVRRYDIDGLHLDDYFYPYREKDSAGQLIPFPDDASWARYQRGGGRLGRDDWRRDNVNRFIARLYREVKAAKPWVKVGISPFGIYRPGFPAQIRGFDQFEAIYADPRAWLANGWLDYLAPQLYWRIDAPAQSFPVLLKWWTENNPRRRLIVAGMNTHGVAGQSDWPASEIVNQVGLARKQPGAAGHIHWNTSALMKNKGGVADELARQCYAQPALVPALDSGTAKTVPRPQATAQATKGGTRFSWSAPRLETVRFWIVQTRRHGVWQTEVVPRDTLSRETPAAPEVFSVRAMDRFGATGEAASLAWSAGR